MDVIVIAPHPDDELLTFGAYIKAHLNAGRRVHVHVVYDGTVTGATRNSGLQTIAPGITPEAVGRVRCMESYEGLTTLGVPPQDIHFEGVQDGTGGNLGVAMDVVGRIVSRYGLDHDYVTTSWADQHPDHANLGRAVRALVPAARARYGVSPLYWPERPSGAPSLVDWSSLAVQDGMPEPLAFYSLSTVEDQQALKRALVRHKLQNYQQGRYGINWRFSVGPQFDFVYATTRSAYHRSV